MIGPGFEASGECWGDSESYRADLCHGPPVKVGFYKATYFLTLITLITLINLINLDLKIPYKVILRAVRLIIPHHTS